ncbi:hypothetical protein BZA05DRAFT_410254 [Tricharina praecox]|uniref:uncharacterized protein n=1 Tax=Tricharina praecox TaxID=43433 RepID=UPI00221ECF90|nr:uncharacterized protein BZA05DRAFT_412724 [Tricharina praecox]XP_051335600.1 uncharacterized protein BZA05DRAFT_410254 [Tricharina praecox]KAI5842054.1 hypothetical protein BZA05DRAFT_412724 [Tricharina praecox]KAI5843657.1 hypothetical protein BZA05DRAFT_410254 [Tricharina praecox]
MYGLCMGFLLVMSRMSVCLSTNMYSSVDSWGFYFLLPWIVFVCFCVHVLCVRLCLCFVLVALISVPVSVCVRCTEHVFLLISFIVFLPSRSVCLSICLSMEWGVKTVFGEMFLIIVFSCSLYLTTLYGGGERGINGIFVRICGDLWELDAGIGIEYEYED